MFGASNLLLSILGLAMLAVQVWALIDCAIRPAQAFPAAGKLTKPAWLAITAIALFVSFFLGGGGLGLFGIVAIVAAIVYLVDVRPAVKEVSDGGNRW